MSANTGSATTRSTGANDYLDATEEVNAYMFGMIEKIRKIGVMLSHQPAEKLPWVILSLEHVKLRISRYSSPRSYKGIPQLPVLPPDEMIALKLKVLRELATEAAKLVLSGKFAHAANPEHASCQYNKNINFAED